MPLLQHERFAPIFESLQGKRIGFVEPQGNVGDRLITLATQQLFATFDIAWRQVDPDSVGDCEELVFGGGGNMGTHYVGNWDLRTRCLASGLPVTVLPQSFLTREDRPFRRVYVRERASLALHPTGILAPDLALGLDYPSTTEPLFARGIFLRRDPESARPRWCRWWSRDPARLCQTPAEYFALAARYAHLITDRLHFAICGLILGRRVTLIGNSYHKNASLYETWLGDLGCQFAASASLAR
jgi:exopolysaccharide biosynthesis predicted pyruvyltransferase EpsI